MTLHVKDGGTWKSAELHVKDGGTWKPVTGSVRDAGTWKEFVSGLTVSPSSTDITKQTYWETCYAYIEYRSTGVEYENSADNSATTDGSRGNWLDAGASSEVWVQRVINSGSLGVDAGSGRLQLSTSRTFGVSAYGTTATCDLTFNFYDAASGGNLIGSAGVVLTATGTNL
ncbi:MAG: hypothetical protein ACYST6_20130 [Planctomycetota bacterium]|jgi:hypothetical protein